MDDELIEIFNKHKNETIEEYMLNHFHAEPVNGDKVRLNEHWSLIVRDVDHQGRLRGVGLKNTAKKE